MGKTDLLKSLTALASTFNYPKFVILIQLSYVPGYPASYELKKHLLRYGFRLDSNDQNPWNLLILIDGLDEIATRSIWTDLSDVIEKLRIRKVGLVFSCRTYYEDPLVPTDFEHLSLEPLDSDAQSKFVEQFVRQSASSEVNSVDTLCNDILKGLREEATPVPIVLTANFIVFKGNPLLLQGIIQDYIEKRELAISAPAILAAVVRLSLSSADNRYKTALMICLKKIAEQSAESHQYASAPITSEKIVSDVLEKVAQDERLDPSALKRQLLHARLLVPLPHGYKIGPHAMVFNFFHAKAMKEKGDWNDISIILKQDRHTILTVASMLEEKNAKQFVDRLQSKVEEAYPVKGKIHLQAEGLHPQLPYACLEAAPITDREFYDNYIRLAIERFKVPHGPTRWTAIDMLAVLGRKVLLSACLINYYKDGVRNSVEDTEKGEVVADIIEVLGWIAQLSPHLREAVAYELDRLLEYVTNEPPRF